jgi:hypothetical protein
MDYMGRKEDQTRAWMLNFVNALRSNPAAYALAEPEIQAISAAVDEFVAALAVVRQATGQNPATTAAKDTALAAAKAICRQYVRIIKANAGISTEMKIAAGITPPDIIRSKSECPLSAPALSVIAATNGAHTLTFYDPLNPDARRKPYGAQGLVLFRGIADKKLTDASQAQFYRIFTTKPMTVFFDAQDNAKTATYYARWFGRRGDMSTPSAPVSMVIAA